MLNRVEIDDTISKEDNIASILKLARSICSDVFGHKDDSNLSTYQYDYSKPAEELGLDEELIVQLIEDYISQIFKAYQNFSDILDSVSQLEGERREELLKDLKALAHKNLGVARNLRIGDAQTLLYELMNNHEDIEYLKYCTEALMACAFRLNPSYAYDVLKLKQLKSLL